MSAIWGAIHLKKGCLPDTVLEMEKPYRTCVIDRYESEKEQSVYMGCGIQYFTPEAKKERLPIVQDGIYFDADVVLDNREEICERLDMEWDEAVTMPDGEILFRFYKRYGAKCLNHILGVFSMVYYDAEKNRVELAIDATGDRCLYYKIENDIFYYSTLLEPLRTEKTTINETWVGDFLGIDYPIMFNDLEETPFEGVFRVAPAQAVRVTIEKTQKKFYWDMGMNKKEIHLKNDAAYKEKFRTLWQQAVIRTLRSEQDISILLSGGMDSSAVACVAGPFLKKQRRTLHAYTSVPLQGYQDDGNPNYITNEMENVKKTQRFLENVECTFVDMPTKHPWKCHTMIMQDMEMPYKSPNLMWILEAMEKAYDQNSRVMLTGEYGNSSVSFTDSELYLKLLLHNKHYLKFLRDIERFQKTMHFDRKYVIKHLLKKEYGKKTQDNKRNRCENSFIEKDFQDKMNVDARLEAVFSKQEVEFEDYKEYCKAMFDRRAFRQIGETATKNSLATGVLMRDPTRNKHIIEFCRRIPLSQYVKGGEDRRLVRVYLKDILPEHVIMYHQIGKQSADLKYRLSRDWEETREEWLQQYTKYNGKSEYVDCEKAMTQLEQNKAIDGLEPFDLTRHMYTLMLLEYCDSFHEA